MWTIERTVEKEGIKYKETVYLNSWYDVLRSGFSEISGYFLYAIVLLFAVFVFALFITPYHAFKALICELYGLEAEIAGVERSNIIISPQTSK